MPRPIVLYVSGENADSIQITSANAAPKTPDAAYFVSADEAARAGQFGPQTITFCAEIGPLSCVFAFGMAALLGFTLDTELVIHTLRKLHTLSASPHHLKPSDELLSTHPSLAHRIAALRQRE